MQVTSTSNVNSASSGATDGVSNLGSQILSQSDFLKLLVAQMTSQDPMNPTNSQDLLTQTVQLSTLQSNTSLQSSLADLQSTQNLLQANALIGRQVTLQVDSNTTAQGTVTGVSLDSGSPQIIVNGTAYELGQVLAIATPSAN